MYEISHEFKKDIEKYMDVIPYLFFGVCTTVVNIGTYWLCAHPLNLNTMISTIVAWVVAIMFAYVTNRKWVFHSEVKSINGIIREIMTFFGCRLTTGTIDCACMFVFVELLYCNDVAIKFMTNILVIVLNYVASRYFIFNKK